MPHLLLSWSVSSKQGRIPFMAHITGSQYTRHAVMATVIVFISDVTNANDAGSRRCSAHD